MNNTLLIINSADRVAGTPSNFMVGFDQRTGVNSFRVNKVTVPYSWYNLKQQQYTVNNINHILPAGSYSVNSLISEINSNIAPIVMSYNANTNKVTFTGLVAFTMVFLYGEGFLRTALSFPDPILAATSHTSTGTINLNLTSNVYLSSQILTTFYQSIFNKRRENIVQTIPVNVNSFGYIIYSNDFATYFKCDEQTFQGIDFQLKTDRGELLDMNGQDIIIEIELFSERPYL